MNEADQVEHNATHTIEDSKYEEMANNTEYDSDDMKIYVRK